MLYLLFHLDADRYAFPARDVKEVLPLVSTKALPGAPAGIVGAVNFRGMAVPVLDLAQLALGRPSARRVSTRLLIVNYPHPDGRHCLLGVTVERATEMISRDPAEFRPVGVATAGARYLGPVIQDAGGMIQRIEIAELLTAELREALFPEAVAGAPVPAGKTP
ncbi:MAG: purine-binding chemotaxis protein CheW [Verrucomicrobia bacterium]|nr:purine-binding chemotaxis protein CheW [Verrucomicrobiota bacterium]